MREADPAQALNHRPGKNGTKNHDRFCTMMNKSFGNHRKRKWLFRTCPPNSIESSSTPHRFIHSLLNSNDGKRDRPLSPPTCELPDPICVNITRIACLAGTRARSRSTLGHEPDPGRNIRAFFSQPGTRGFRGRRGWPETAGQRVSNGANGSSGFPLFLSGKIRFN